jgi:hypothetical protein
MNRLAVASIRPARRVQPKEPEHPSGDVPPPRQRLGISAFGPTTFVGTPRLLPARVLGFASRTSCSPCPLLSNFLLEAVLPHAEQRMLVQVAV